MCMYGYVRISNRRKQDTARQIKNIQEAYPQAVIIQEKMTGTTMDRPEWNKLYKKADSTTTIIFDSVSRMSRGNPNEALDIYENLYNRGVNLIFLKEPHINTETYKQTLQGLVSLTNTDVDYILEGVNKYLMALAKTQILIAFQQSAKEAEDIRQRTKEALAISRLNGKTLGKQKGDTWETKKSKEAKRVIQKHSKDFGGSLTDVEVIKMLGITRNSYYKYKRELKEHLETIDRKMNEMKD